VSAAFAFAFSAGVLAALNPCGAPMLPGWIGFFLFTDQHDQHRDALSRLLRGIGTSLAVTAGLIAMFATVGLAVNFGL
jgi:cytochrome c biogenesis protein CcdA